MPTNRITIVGGGPAGVSTLYQLIEHFSKKPSPSPIEITIIEKSPQFGLGLPYATPVKHHILNLPANIMSLDPENSSHFREWLEKNKTQWEAHYSQEEAMGDFPPRALFGLYLSDTFKTTCEKAALHGITIQSITDEVVNVFSAKENEQQKKITLKDGRFFYSDYTLLAPGHLAPDSYHALKGTPGYIHNPWPTSTLNNIPKDADVAMAGTRLTAIDAVLTLKDNGHTGKIHLFSRTGLMPCVIGKTSPYTASFFTLENMYKYRNKRGQVSLDVIVNLLKQEIERAEGKTFDEKQSWIDLWKKPSNAKNWLQKEIKASDEEVRPWQSVLWSIYAIVPQVWQLMSNADKTRFFRDYYSVWMTYLAAFPVDNARRLLPYIESGEVIVHAGLEGVKYDQEMEQFVVKCNKGTDMEFKHFVNATGPGYDVNRADEPLLKALTKQGEAKAHPQGGLVVDPRTFELIDRHDKTGSTVYLMGDMTRGTNLATTDMGQAARHAKIVVGQVVRSLHQKYESSFELSSAKVYLINPNGHTKKKLKLQHDGSMGKGAYYCGNDNAPVLWIHRTTSPGGGSQSSLTSQGSKESVAAGVVKVKLE